MDGEIHEICCGCLSSGRKMVPLQHYWSDQAVYQILADIPMLIHKDFWMCWECRQRITNFVDFREQIKDSCKVLHNYVEQNNKIKPLVPLSKLISHIQKGIDIDSSDTNVLENGSCSQVVCEDIKKETFVINTKEVNDVHVKDEEVYSDDDRSLIDIRNEKINDIKKENPTRKRFKIKTKKKKKPDDYEKIILSTEEVMKERHLLASREEYVNAMFKCEKCLITFPNSDDMTDHAVNKHARHSKHICAICECCFPSQNSLTVHGHRHHHRWRCSLCGHHGATERAATKHTHKHAQSENYDIAEKAYQIYEENKTQRDVETNGTKSENQIPCEYCDKIFRWKTSLRKHMETHRIESGHKRRPFCETCNLAFTTTANLRKHVSTSSKHQIQLKLRKLKENLPQSDLEQQAKDIESIKTKINSQREQFPCPQCDKKFQWKGNLLRHLKSHAARANGDLICVPCNRTFSSIATYKQHMKISRKHVTENEFKYMCSDCGKRFSNKIKLRDHIDWDHLKNYTHTCTHCQKVFKSHTSLYLHKQVVHKQYNAEHLCDHCGKSFPNKTKLRSHIIAIHSRESPYKCTECSARFSWHSCLSRHVRRVHGTRARER